MSSNTSSFSLLESAGFSVSLISFNDVIPFLNLKISLDKCDFNAAALLSSLSSNNLIWVSMSSEWCFGVAVVFNIEVVVEIGVVILDELTWDGWLSNRYCLKSPNKSQLHHQKGYLKPHLLD